MKASKFVLAFLAAVALLVTTAAPAEAAFRLRVQDGTGTGVVISDNGAGDLNPLTGAIVFSGAIGGVANVTVAIGVRSGPPNNFPFPDFFDAIDLTAVQVQTSGAGVIRILLEGDGFNAAPDGAIVLQMDVGGTMSAPIGSTAVFRGWANPANLIPTFGPDTFPAGALPGIPDLPPAGSTGVSMTVPPFVAATAFGGSRTAGFSKSGAYSLFSEALVTFTGAGTITFDQCTGTTPAPAGLLLLAAGVPALVYASRRKKAVKA